MADKQYVILKDKNNFQAAMKFISPNRVLDRQAMAMLVLVETIVFSVIWVSSPFPMLPTPEEVWRALADQWATKGLGYHLMVSLGLNLQAILVATVISLGMAYLTVLPVFRPVVMVATKLRFLSMTGLGVAFALMFATKHEIKLAMLTFSIGVFFITSMLDVLACIPKEQMDLARTLRMGEWRVVYEVVVLGQADKAFDALRQNVAVGWMMLTLIETVAFSEGGIGTVLQTMQLHARFADIMGIQILILLVGLGQDWMLGQMKNFFCPYAQLTVMKR